MEVLLSLNSVLLCDGCCQLLTIVPYVLLLYLLNLFQYTWAQYCSHYEWCHASWNKAKHLIHSVDSSLVKKNMVELFWKKVHWFAPVMRYIMHFLYSNGMNLLHGYRKEHIQHRWSLPLKVLGIKLLLKRGRSSSSRNDTLNSLTCSWNVQPWSWKCHQTLLVLLVI